MAVCVVPWHRSEELQLLHQCRRSVMAAMSPPATPTAMSLVQELVSLAQLVAVNSRPRVCQRKNSANIARRMKLLSPLFEEVRDSRPPIPPSAVQSFRNVHRTMRRAKLLLDNCREGSCFWLLMECENIARQFHELTQQLFSELEALPTELLELSDEVREQVQLVHMQVGRARCFVDPVEAQLREEVLGVLLAFERKEVPDHENLRRLFAKLLISSATDCQKELQLLDEELGNQASSDLDTRKLITSLISFIRYSKCVLFGVSDGEDSDESSRTSQNSSGFDSGEVSTSGRGPQALGAGLNPPDEFRCPISLDLMRDPVILASGQTYDRASIGKWLAAGHSTCPKSGQKLLHVSLIPNYALRSLIIQWCEDHHVPFEKPDKNCKKTSGVDHLANTRAALEATKMTAAFLVGKLATGSPEVQKQVAYELRLLAKCGMENRMCIAEAGAVPFLLPLLSSKDPKTQENAVTALLNLSIFDNNKMLIIAAGALDPILTVLASGSSMEARANAAATLFSLSSVDENKVTIGSKPAAIPALVKLLQEGNSRGKKDAATALFNLSLYHLNKAKVVSAGAVPVLVSLLADDWSQIAHDALAVLALLAGSEEGLAAISETSAIPVLVNFLSSGSPRGKENSIAVLLSLCRVGGDQTIATVLKQSSTIPSVYALLGMGTPRAKRKASSLLKILQRWEYTVHRTLAS